MIYRIDRLHSASCVIVGLVGCLLLPGRGTCSEPLIAIPMVAARWQTDGRVEFAQREGLPNGLMQLSDGNAALQGLEFRDGTIEFDVRPLADDMPGIQFRRRNADDMEIFYLRPNPECPVAQDCIQYVPRVHGVMPWEMYPEYQAAAPVAERGWSHIKLVISGRRMNVFINRAAAPTMTVGHLEGDARAGGLTLMGPAAFANMTVTPGATEGLPPAPAPDPAANDPGLVRHWQVSQPSSRNLDTIPTLSQMPSASPSWQPISAEPYGLINLSRLYGSPTDRSTGALAWLKTDIRSDRAQVKRVSIGFLHEASVFVGGRMVFSGQNLYVAGTPIGRLSLRNGSFDLPLRQGDNEVVVALNNILAVGHNHYGWGLEFRLDEPSGVTLPAAPML